jgi:hypothetical protein
MTVDRNVFSAAAPLPLPPLTAVALFVLAYLHTVQIKHEHDET